MTALRFRNLRFGNPQGVTRDLASLVDDLAGVELLVLGEAMLDTYLEGSSSRLSAEAPVPVVGISARRHLPGGAANSAANAACLGAHATFLSVVGDDREADLLREALERAGVSADGLVTERGRETLAKSRVVADEQLLVRVDSGSTGPLRTGTEDALLARLADAARDADAIVVSDYGYGVVAPRVRALLSELRLEVLVVDAKDLRAYRDVRPTAVKPNYAQALALLGLQDGNGARTDVIAAEGARILEATGARIAAVTLDGDGALVLEDGCEAYRTYARRRPRSRTMGAGDTFASTLALAIAAGADTPAAAELAAAASSVVVAKDGTSLCSADELRAAVSGGSKIVAERSRLQAVLARHREEGRRIVLTNGCFDILHRGHVTYLSRAKTLGDVLVVGVNSDASVAALKGPDRPVNPLEDRAHVLAALSFVDLVVPFEEATPEQLVRTVRPDVFAKGGDYTLAMLPEAAVVEELGGRVELLGYVDDRSTTGLIDRIRSESEPAASHST